VSNLFLGQEAVEDGITKAARTLDEIEMEQRSVDLLRQLAVRTLRSVRTEVGSLSGGQRQTVAIARSMLGEPKIVMLDEPTAALGVAQTRQVLDLILRLKERGLGVVLISHNMADVMEVADRIIVLRLGRRVATFDRPSTTHDEVVAAITGARQP
jgi:D-xylose transport system ATP-binding protein